MSHLQQTLILLSELLIVTLQGLFLSISFDKCHERLLKGYIFKSHIILQWHFTMEWCIFTSCVGLFFYQLALQKTDYRYNQPILKNKLYHKRRLLAIYLSHHIQSLNEKIERYQCQLVFDHEDKLSYAVGIWKLHISWQKENELIGHISVR
jgi:hypothetical protein